VIEVASGAALLWRLNHDFDVPRREQVERTSLKVVGWCFIGLALYIVYECGSNLVRREAPERSIPGIIIASAAVIVMPLLARGETQRCCRDRKRCHARRLPADGLLRLPLRNLLGGLVLNALVGWLWADAIAGLAMVPIIAKEGIHGLRRDACCHDCGC